MPVTIFLSHASHDDHIVAALALTFSILFYTLRASTVPVSAGDTDFLELACRRMKAPSTRRPGR
jgi:hypothetical protein